jgi:hypothetical protein
MIQGAEGFLGGGHMGIIGFEWGRRKGCGRRRWVKVVVCRRWWVGEWREGAILDRQVKFFGNSSMEGLALRRRILREERLISSVPGTKCLFKLIRIIKETRIRGRA